MYEHTLSDIFYRMDQIDLVSEEKEARAANAGKPEDELTDKERLDIIEQKLDELIVIIGQRQPE